MTHPPPDRPFLSIIMPMYNRAAFVGRAIRSCLEQDFTDFDLIIVDDASTDGSASVVEQFDDRRIRLLRHERNRGRCPARNTAMEAARGQWFVFLDSDDELLPGALTSIHRRAVAAAPDVVGLRFMCVDERGTSPDPPHDDRVWDYEAYLRWLDVSVDGKQETLPCSRASTFEAVRYADDHAPEGGYHLELARLGSIRACSDVVRRYHHDAPNRITLRLPEHSLRYALDVMNDTGRILKAHGDALRRWAPRSYWLLIAGGASASFLAGKRIGGLGYSVRALRIRPFALRVWVIAFFGMLGPRPLVSLQWLRARLVSRLERHRRQRVSRT